MFERLTVSPTRFAEKSQSWEGSATVGDFERLAGDFVRPDAGLSFSVSGELDARGRPRLRCTVSVQAEVECQRCQKPVAVQVDSARVLYLAGSEEEAERLETVLANEGLEVIVVDKTLGLATVVEDEVLLSLPLVPVHDECAHEFARLGQAE